MRRFVPLRNGLAQCATNTKKGCRGGSLIRTLLADSEFLNDVSVAVDVLGANVVEEASATADQFEQATT